MANHAQEVDFTSLIAAINSMILVIGSNGRTLSAINTDFSPVKYAHIAGSGTFAVQGTAGSLLSLNINSGDVASTGTIYDASGTATIAGSLVVGIFHFGTAVPAEVSLGPSGRGLTLNNGLVIVTTGTADITFGHT